MVSFRSSLPETVQKQRSWRRWRRRSWNDHFNVDVCSKVGQRSSHAWRFTANSLDQHPLHIPPFLFIFLHTRCAEAAMLISPGREWQYVLCHRAVISIHAITQPLCSTPEALDDCHLTQWHTPQNSQLEGENPCSSHLSPPAHTLDGSAARISMHDFLMIWRSERENKNGWKESQGNLAGQHRFVCHPLCMGECLWVYMLYRVDDSP